MLRLMKHLTLCDRRRTSRMNGSKILAIGAYKRMKIFRGIFLVLSFVSAVYAAEDVVTALHGTIEKVDSGAKTIVVKTDDGIDHSLHVAGRTTVHGADASEKASEDSWHGLKEGGEVVVHYT